MKRLWYEASRRPIMSLTKSVSNITLEGAKVLIAAAEAKATEIVRSAFPCPSPTSPHHHSGALVGGVGGVWGRWYRR